jgi:hypothetical protein
MKLNQMNSTNNWFDRLEEITTIGIHEIIFLMLNIPFASSAFLQKLHIDSTNGIIIRCLSDW